MSERHTSSSEAEQQLIFDLMHARLIEMFGAGGNFRISIGRPTAEDAVFVATVADTLAHHVATAFNPQRETPGRRAAPTTIAEHDALWQQIEGDLDVRRTGADSVEVDVEREIAAAAGDAQVEASPVVSAVAQQEPAVDPIAHLIGHAA